MRTIPLIHRESLSQFILFFLALIIYVLRPRRVRAPLCLLVQSHPLKCIVVIDDSNRGICWLGNIAVHRGCEERCRVIHCVRTIALRDLQRSLHFFVAHQILLLTLGRVGLSCRCSSCLSLASLVGSLLRLLVGAPLFERIVILANVYRAAQTGGLGQRLFKIIERRLCL